MDTVEIVVYLLVATIIGGLILYVTYDMVNQDIVGEIEGQLEDNLGFEVVNNETVGQHLFQIWQECDFGASEDNFTFQYEGQSTSKEDLFAEIKRLNLCRSLSSELNACGEREDLMINISSGEIEAGILNAQCSRDNGVGVLRVCKASGCEQAPY